VVAWFGNNPPSAVGQQQQQQQDDLLVFHRERGIETELYIKAERECGLVTPTARSVGATLLRTAESVPWSGRTAVAAIVAATATAITQTAT